MGQHTEARNKSPHRRPQGATRGLGKEPGKEQRMKKTQRFERRLKDAKEGNEIDQLKAEMEAIEMEVVG